MSMQTVVQSVVEHSTNPNVAIPSLGAGSLANMLVMIPNFINILMLIYAILLVSHKVWNMYKEWRDDPSAPGHSK